MQTPKPIEPGCLVVIVGAERVTVNIGKTAQVIKFVPPGAIIEYRGYVTQNDTTGPGWIVESGDIMALKNMQELTRIGWALIAAHNLRRIDDYEPEADDLELYDRHGQLENKSQCQNTVSKFTTRASLCAKA